MSSEPSQLARARVASRQAARAERQSHRRQIVDTALSAAVPDLSSVDIDQYLLDARAEAGNSLRELADHLKAHPGALLSGDAHGPRALLRLIGALVSGGHAVTVPCCSSCGKTTVNLPRVAESGRICQACDARQNHLRDCSRCERKQVRIIARRPEGGICNACYRSDPHHVVPCARCERLRRPVARLDDGSGVCASCWVPVPRECSACGRIRTVLASSLDGLLFCTTCYSKHRQPRRACGACGAERTILQRAVGDQPDLCGSCYARPSAFCSHCGRHRPGRTNAEGRFICKLCTPRKLQPCSRCSEQRPVQRRLPRGALCARCYYAVYDHPAPCSTCQRVSVLVALDELGTEICGPCSGSSLDPRCETCRRPGRHYQDNKCAQCALSIRLKDALRGPDGSLNPQLEPVRDMLLASGHQPAGLVGWLMRSPNAHLLHELAKTGLPVSHELLDEQPQSRHEIFVRQLLIQSGVLPPRNDDIDRIPRWLEDLLQDQPDDRALLVRPFTHWFVLRRARRSAARRRRPGDASDNIRKRIRVALEFLTWLDAVGRSIENLDQTLLDQWLADGTARSHGIRDFLTWARSCSLVGDLRVPSVPKADPENFLDDTTRWKLLRRCLDDESIALDSRAAAALILLFGLRGIHIRHLTIEHIRTDNDQSFLVTGDHQLRLPPKLADLLRRLAAGERRRSRYQGQTTAQWLFPGLSPGRPLSSEGLTAKLRDLGIQTTPARNSALISLAAQLPSPVLADLLGLHDQTSVRWARLASHDWQTYVASRSATNSAAVE